MVSYQSYPAPLFSLCLRAFVCVLCTLMDQCTAEENDLRTPPVLLSFFPSVSLCVCVLILLTAPDGTWAQPMEMTGREYFLCRRLSFFFFFLQPCFSCFCRYLTCAQKQLSRDKYWPCQTCRWGLLCFWSICGCSGPWKSRLKLMGPINRQSEVSFCWTKGMNPSDSS